MAGSPKLIVLSEQLRGKSFQLTKDLQTCGRTEERDICLKDPTISSHHCDFVRTGETYTIKDRGSTNGTRVNNVPITEQELQNSDIVQAGGVEILYDCDDKSVTTVMRTQTGINLEDSESSGTIVKKLDNASPFKRKGAEGSQLVVIGVVVFLVVVIIALLAYLMIMMFGQSGSTANLSGSAIPALLPLFTIIIHPASRRSR